jgi:hypothetical protein
VRALGRFEAGEEYSLMIASEESESFPVITRLPLDRTIAKSHWLPKH